MNRHAFVVPAVAAFSLALAVPAQAGSREDLLVRYAAKARADDPVFAGFSVARGKAFHVARPAVGNADTPSCTSCHGGDPRVPGTTRTGKSVAPMAVSVTPDRYTDPAKVEKWFRRNCRQVLGRECTALEKGDWLTAMIQF